MSPWQTALRDLRAEFLSFSRADLYCGLVRGPLEFKDFLSPTVGIPLPSDELGRSSRPIISISNVEAPPSLGVGFRLKLIMCGNDGASFPEFQRLAREAARCIARDSQALVAESIPFEWWLNRVAELALEKRPESPLAADAFRYPPLPRPTDENLAASSHKIYYVILTSNIFRCSVWAIDLILRPGPARRPVGGVKMADAIEPLLSQDDLTRVLNTSRRTVERMRAAGKLPKPDLLLNRMPRWRPDTIRTRIERGGRP